MQTRSRFHTSGLFMVSPQVQNFGLRKKSRNSYLSNQSAEDLKCLVSWNNLHSPACLGSVISTRSALSLNEEAALSAALFVFSSRSGGARPAACSLRGDQKQGGEHHSGGPAQSITHRHLLLVAWQQLRGNSSMTTLRLWLRLHQKH